MRLRAGRARALAGGLVVCWLGCGCAREPQAPRTELFRNAAVPIGLVSGDTVAAGDQLYLTVRTERPCFVYVVSEDDSGSRWMIHPCRGADGSGRALTAGRLHRLPLSVLGREAFWPVRSVTPRERLLVLASERPVAALDAAVTGAAGSEPCLARLDGVAGRWIERLAAAPGAMAPSLRPLRADDGSRVWLTAYALSGVPGHDSG